MAFDVKAYQRAYQNTYQWARKLAKHGLTPDTYREMLDAQGGGCAICGRTAEQNPYGNRTRRLPVDHCHETGHVRGILCDPCNRALGLLGEDPARIQRAANYLIQARTGRMSSSSASQ